MPNRQQIFKIALSVGLSRDDTNRYLQYGISETAFQENDYREFIVMYCLDHGIGLQKCEEMISFYESKCHNRGQWEQNTHTDWLRRQYEIVKLYKEQDFLLWMYKHQKYFKGYSLTVLHCYQELMTKCLRIFRENMRQSLVVLLKEVGFFSWVAKKQGEQKYDENDIERFVKNRLRSSSHALDSNKAKEIRNLVSIVYASHDRICDLIQGVYTKMPAWRQGGTQRRVYHTLRNHMQRIDEKYLSELLNMALHKERQMRLQMLLAQEDNEQKRNELQKQLRKNKGRLHMIQRSDLLILEGMYGEPDKLVKAREHKHMTMYEAAKIAKEAEVPKLWLTHYSPSMTRPEEFMEDVRKIFPAAYAAKDGWTMELKFDEGE